MNYLIIVSSVTYAVKGKKILERNGLRCKIKRVPQELSQCGCGYCIELTPRYVYQGVRILRAGGIKIKNMYLENVDGTYTEVVERDLS